MISQTYMYVFKCAPKISFVGFIAPLQYRGVIVGGTDGGSSLRISLFELNLADNIINLSYFFAKYESSIFHYMSNAQKRAYFIIKNRPAHMQTTVYPNLKHT